MFFNRETKFNIGGKFVTILRTLVWPYLFFTTLIWLPKALARGRNIAFADFATDIFGGYASWYVAALIVAECVFSFMVRYIKSPGRIVWGGTVCLLVYYCLYLLWPGYRWPWYFDEGIKAVFFLSLGYWYARKRPQLDSYIGPSYAAVATGVFLVGVFAFRNLDIFHLTLGEFFVTVVLSVIGIYMIINLSCLMQRVKFFSFLTYIGRNSLTYYFLNGGCILVTCKILEKAGLIYRGNYLSVFAITVFVALILTCAAWVINRYFPIVLGKKEAVDRMTAFLRRKCGKYRRFGNAA